MTVFRFHGRATGSDPTGYVYRNWSKALEVSVLAETKQEATDKALKMLGAHPRWGNFRDHGWALIWDSMDEESE